MKKKNNIKISYGYDRGKLISISNNYNIRPTCKRIKVTVFGFLKKYIKNKICLDLFSGTGSLMMESLSLGAKKIVVVEKNTYIIKKLKAILTNFDTNRVVLFNTTAKYYIVNSFHKFHIIFLDPPYNINNLHNIILFILKKKLLFQEGIIYLELNNLYFFKNKYKKLHLHVVKKVGNTFICLLIYKG